MAMSFPQPDRVLWRRITERNGNVGLWLVCLVCGGFFLPLVFTLLVLLTGLTAKQLGFANVAAWLGDAFFASSCIAAWFYFDLITKVVAAALVLFLLFIVPILVVYKGGIGALCVGIGGLALMLDRHIHPLLKALRIFRVRNTDIWGNPRYLPPMPDFELNTLWVALPLLAVGIPLWAWRTRRLRKKALETVA